MKQVFFLLSMIFCNEIFSQNVGVGTQAPAAKFSVGTTSQFQIDNTGNIQRINDVPYSFPYIQGTSGQVLMNDGTGQLNWANTSSIITITESNYLTTVILPNNYIKIDGSISLTQDYSGLNKANLTITGGQISGNGVGAISIGDNVTFAGTTFSDLIDIKGNSLTFINCKFLGILPSIGLASDPKFYNCTFTGATIGSVKFNGFIANSIIDGCSIIRASSLTNCNISNSIIGTNTINNISDCKIDKSTLYSLTSKFQFINNRCEESRLIIGNANQSPTEANISNNTFDNLLSGTTELIEINPSRDFIKFLNIHNNIFELQTGQPRSIAVIANDGLPTRSILNIQGNIFYNGLNTIYYSSDINTIYSQNVASRVDHPSASGNLQVVNNFD